MKTKFFERTPQYVILADVYIEAANRHKEKMLAQLEKLSYEIPTTDGLGYPLDPRKVKENRNSFIKQQKLNEAKQARKDQMRRGRK